MTTITGRSTSSVAAPPRQTGRWLTDWRPEDPDFWDRSGKRIARRNLVFSVFTEHIGFSVWVLWSAREKW